jgi:transcriptional regulator with XRE-family HTH domain
MLTTKTLITTIRKQSKLTQEEFGKLFKTERARVSDWERGLNSISFNKAMEICEYFKVDLCKLINKK